MRDGSTDELREIVLARRQYAALVLHRAAHRAKTTDRVIHLAWPLIAANQKRLSPRRIAGGATDPATETIRAPLAEGRLPRIGVQLWASRARGDRVCSCCGLLIARGEVEYEPHTAPGLYARLHCFRTWSAESAALDGNGGQQRR